MSWEIFKRNVLSVTSRPEAINDIDLVAKTFATEYDAAVKRGGDTLNSISLKAGNVQLMEQIFRSALQKGLTATEPYDLVGEMGKGVLAYWNGATLNEFPIPIIPATGASANVGVVSNFIVNPGTWAPVLDLGSVNFKLTPEQRGEIEQQLKLATEVYQKALTYQPPDLIVAHDDKISSLTNSLSTNEVYRVDIPFPKPIQTSDTQFVNLLGELVDQGDYEGREELGGENGPTYSDENSGGGGSGGGGGDGGPFKQSVPYFPAGASVAQKVIAIALTDLNDGVKEVPLGSNTGHPRLLTIQYTAARAKWTEYPWCAATVFTWWKEAGFPFTDDPNDPAYLVNPKHCLSWYSWAVKTGRWVEKRNRANPNFVPKPGDAVIYNTDGITLDHMALVYEFKDNKLTSLDGNYKHSVAFNVSYNSYIAGYVKL